MEYRQLGRTNLRVSLLGLGSGGANRLGRARHADASESYALVRRALDLGINLFDTAPAYESEAVLGEALDGVARERYVLCTKFNASRGGPGPGALRSSLEASLRRLRADYVDVMYFHGVPPEGYASVLTGFMDELRKAQDDQLVRFLGITERYEADPAHSMLLQALRDDLFDVIMLGHNLVSPGGLLKVLPLAQRTRVGVVIMCAVRTIITTPSMLRETIRGWKAEGAVPEDAVPDEAPLDWVLEPGVESLADAAYKFAVESSAVSSVLTGTASIRHLEANARAVLGPPLSPATSRRLQDIFIPANRSVQLEAFQRPTSSPPG